MKRIRIIVLTAFSALLPLLGLNATPTFTIQGGTLTAVELHGDSEIILPDGVTGIRDYAFRDCYSLTSLIIPASVTSIGGAAFYGCSNLARITFMGSEPSLGSDTFDYVSVNCVVKYNDGSSSVVNKMTIRNGVLTYLSPNCKTDVVIPSSVTRIGNGAFSYCNGVKSVTIPSSVTKIGDEAFYECSSLTSMTIPGSVKNVGGWAFYGCSGLTNVIFGAGVTSMGVCVFRNCSGLTGMTIPGSVTNIGARAFEDCNGLTNLIFLGNAPDMGDYVFSRTAPDCCAHVYRASTGWDVEIPGTWNGIGIDYIKRSVVVFDANGGSGGTSIEQDWGTAIVAPIVSRTGYTFIGWLPDVDATVPESTVTYTAQWRVNQYTVTFDANGGTGGTSAKQDYGTPIIAPTVARDGYMFIGWSPEVDVTVPASNVAYRARWQSDMKILYAYPFRQNVDYTSESGFLGCALSASVITNTDAQPLLYETFGMQVRVDPSGMTDIDLASIEVHMAWFTGETPWGWENWINNANVKDVVLDRASDWSAGNLVYRSNPNVSDSFIPPQIPKAEGYQVVQYHIWVKFKDGNGVWQAVRHLGDSDGDWTRPYWYNPVDKNKDYGTFSAYTLLDVFAPKRVWLNEVNMYRHGNLDDVTHQYVEIAAPQGCDLNGWSLEAITQDNEYIPRRLFTMGQDGVASCKDWPATNRYVFYAIQSPRTMAAGTYGQLDGVWWSDAFRYGTEDISRPCALRLVRPSGIVEHEVVFMCTNTYASYSPLFAYLDGTNFLKEVKENVTSGDTSQWFYAGADDQGYAGKDCSLGVYTGHGEANTWTNAMVQTPGEANRLADGTQQSIDPDYFNPPPRLEIYAYINWDNRDVMSLVVDGITNTSRVIVVPYNYYDGTFATRSIDFLVEDGYEIDTVTTNGVNVVEASGKKGCWTLNINLCNPYSYNFVLASARLENYGVVAEKATCERTDGGYSLTAKDGETLVEGDIALTAVLDGTVVDTTKGYDAEIASDGKSATVRLKTPTFGAAALVAGDDPPETDSSDPTGTLVESDGVTLSTQPWPNDDEEIGALSVAAVPGLYYQAAWGGSLDNLTTGEKAQATTDTLYLGVIKQTGTSGFYKVTVSEQ